MKRVEIISIGDELLRGIVAETNSHWLAKRIAARGGSLERVVLLPDAPPVVAGEIRAALERSPALLITHGGLGPTDDDRTRHAIALALDVPLVPHAEAGAIVRRRFDELLAQGIVADPALGEARARMANLPRGAQALDNQVGTAPGIVIAGETTILLALPGVPPELAWIWNHPAAPILDRVLGPGGFAETTRTLALRDESAIAHVVAAVARRHPEVYVKSRAKGYGEGDEIRVTVHATAATDEAARRLVDAAWSDMSTALTAEGIEAAEGIEQTDKPSGAPAP